jgi:hypothetical protein
VTTGVATQTARASPTASGGSAIPPRSDGRTYGHPRAEHAAIRGRCGDHGKQAGRKRVWPTPLAAGIPAPTIDRVAILTGLVTRGDGIAPVVAIVELGFRFNI